MKSESSYMEKPISRVIYRKDPPLYTRTRDRILELINNGHFPPGSKLPAETELTIILGVSRVILREALRVLEEDNIIIRRHGKPTIVNQPFPLLFTDLNTNYSFSEVIQQNGLQPGISYLSVESQYPDDELVKSLNIRSDVLVKVIQRVRTANGQPIAYTIDYYQDDLINAELEDFRYGASIYSLLKEKNMEVHHSLAQILPIKVGIDVAEKLKINPETVILLLKQVDYLQDNTPILYTEEYHLRQAFRFTVYRVRK